MEQNPVKSFVVVQKAIFITFRKHSSSLCALEHEFQTTHYCLVMLNILYDKLCSVLCIMHYVMQLNVYQNLHFHIHFCSHKVLVG